MEIDSMISAVNGKFTGAETKQEKEKLALEFEEIFARKLVKEMTKDSFKMGDNSSVMGSANKMYRNHIIDTMATELAAQRKLGMADMVSNFLNHKEEINGKL